jgi:chloramphenicol 3-O-phosphotransferase
MAAGKSTVARLLAERFERGVYLEGDFFRRSVVSGRVEVTPDASPEAAEQLRLRYRLAATAADAYCQAGFTVALEDVVAGPLLAEYMTLIRSRPCHVIVLMPSLEALAAREAARHNKGYEQWTVGELYEGFATKTPRIGHWLDTSEQTAEETVEEILARTPSVPVSSSSATTTTSGRPCSAGSSSRSGKGLTTSCLRSSTSAAPQFQVSQRSP